MKQYRKKWISAFFITVLTIACLIMGFMLYMKEVTYKPQTSESPKHTEQKESKLPDDYVNYQDNVGGVSFTEDQITELVRNIYYLDGFINNLSVDFEDDNSVKVVGKIKDIDILCDMYPELSAYYSLLKMIEDKNITFSGKFVNNNGLADFEILSASVGDFQIDKNILVPFIEEGAFAQLFNVEYDSMEIFNDSVIFKEGVPDILSY